MSAPPVNFFRPERLEGEGLKTYRHRRNLSSQAAHMGWIMRNHQATKAKKARRALVAAIGIRQAKKWLRLARASRRESMALQAQQMSTAPSKYIGPGTDGSLTNVGTHLVSGI
jgi:hypothetical protein